MKHSNHSHLLRNHLLLNRRLMFHPDGDSGGNGNGGSGAGGTGNGTGNGTGSGTSGGGDDLAERLARAFEGVTRREGSAEAAGQALLRENHDYREQIRTLRSRVPADGAVVLTGDDAAAWTAYRELGDVPTIQTALTERQTLAERVAATERRETVRSAAGVANYNEAALERLVNQDNLTLAVDGEGDARTAVVVTDSARTPLADYVQQHAPEMLPALTAGRGRQGTPHPGQQSSGGKAPAGSAVDEFIERRKERAAKGNPFKKKTA